MVNCMWWPTSWPATCAYTADREQACHAYSSTSLLSLHPDDHPHWHNQYHSSPSHLQREISFKYFFHPKWLDMNSKDPFVVSDAVLLSVMCSHLFWVLDKFFHRKQRIPPFHLHNFTSIDFSIEAQYDRHPTETREKHVWGTNAFSSPPHRITTLPARRIDALYPCLVL